MIITDGVDHIDVLTWERNVKYAHITMMNYAKDLQPWGKTQRNMNKAVICTHAESNHQMDIVILAKCLEENNFQGCLFTKYWLCGVWQVDYELKTGNKKIINR